MKIENWFSINKKQNLSKYSTFQKPIKIKQTKNNTPSFVEWTIVSTQRPKMHKIGRLSKPSSDSLEPFIIPIQFLKTVKPVDMQHRCEVRYPTGSWKKWPYCRSAGKIYCQTASGLKRSHFEIFEFHYRHKKVGFTSTDVLAKNGFMVPNNDEAMLLP